MISIRLRLYYSNKGWNRTDAMDDTVTVGMPIWRKVSITFLSYSIFSYSLEMMVLISLLQLRRRYISHTLLFFIFINMTDLVKGQQLVDACESGGLDTARKLLDKGIDVNWKDVDGDTGLILGSRHGHVEVVKLFLNRGAHTDIQNKYGWTPLMEASFYGNVDCARLLLETGAGISIKNNDGYTATDWAKEKGHVDIAYLLDEYETKKKYGLVGPNLLQTLPTLDKNIQNLTTEAAVKTKQELYQVHVKNLQEEVNNLRQEVNEFQEREIALRSEIQTLQNTLAAQEQQLKQQTIREEDLLLEYESVDAGQGSKML